MKKYYTLKTNVGPMLKDIPIIEINPIMCNAQWLFLKELYHSDKISYTNFFGGESFTVRNATVTCSPITSEIYMPIIVDEDFIDVVTGERIDCNNMYGQRSYSEFITIDQQIDIIYIEHLLRELEKDEKSVELYADAIEELVSLLEKYKDYSSKLKDEKLKKESSLNIECQKNIHLSQTRIREKLENRKKN